MTAEEMITKFRSMVDDTLDGDLELQLVNDAKDTVEGLAIWEILKYETSYPVSSGYSYSSALGALPTRFALPVRMCEGTSDVDYDKIDFEDRFGKVNAPYGYFIDMAAGNVHLSGQNHSSKTMYFYHTRYSADLALSGTWAFPSRFHSIIPVIMAELYYPIDGGERGRSWDDKWSKEKEDKLSQMILWNDQLKMKGRRPRNTNRYASPKANI